MIDNRATFAKVVKHRLLPLLALEDTGTTYLDYGLPRVALERQRWAESRHALLVLGLVPRRRHVETGGCSSRE